MMTIVDYDEVVHLQIGSNRTEDLVCGKNKGETTSIFIR